jgi:hypothetical protein
MQGDLSEKTDNKYGDIFAALAVNIGFICES